MQLKNLVHFLFAKSIDYFKRRVPDPNIETVHSEKKGVGDMARRNSQIGSVGWATASNIAISY
jgi:hypothetical protein